MAAGFGEHAPHFGGARVSGRVVSAARPNRPTSHKTARQSSRFESLAETTFDPFVGAVEMRQTGHLRDPVRKLSERIPFQKAADA